MLRKSLIFTVFTLMLVNFAFGDNIYLKDGSQIKGLITQTTDTAITIQTEFGVMNVPKNKVQNVLFDSSPAKESKSLQPQNQLQAKEQPEQEAPAQKPQERTKAENWYMSVALGLGASQPLDDLKTLIQNTSTKTEYKDNKKYPAFYFNYAFYASAGNNLLLGASLTLLGSPWEENATYNNHNYSQSYSYTAVLLNLDLKIFFSEIGSGLYLSAAPGIGALSYTKKESYYTTQDKTYNAKSVYGIKGGLGYAIAFKRFDRIMTIGLEGFYVTGKYKNDFSTTEAKFSIAGGYLNIGFLW